MARSQPLIAKKHDYQMVLKSINLQNFRNYQKREFKFSPETTLVAGPNTSGKTNLLEAICLLATGKSFRAGVEREMISYGEEIARVEGVITLEGARDTFLSHEEFASDARSAVGVDFQVRSKGSLRAHKEKTSLEILFTTGQVKGKKVAKKKYLVNGVGKRMMDFVGNLRVVYFGPQDLEIVVNSPSIRRDYLDSVLEPVDKDYRRASLSYQKGLRQRNKILERIRELGIRELERAKRQLYFWNNLLIKNGEIITQKREELIDFINAQPDWFYDLSLDYQKSIISPARLEKYQEQEIEAGMTLVGPHRDDFRIEGGDGRWEAGRDLSVYGSRGEQRTAVFSLKLAELEFVAEKTGARPVLLLDDIFSELDHEHRKRLVEVIPKQQTLITTTDLHLVEPKFRKETKLIELK